MFRNVLSTVALCTAFGVAAAAAPPLVVRYESTVETSAALTSLPAQVPDRVATRACFSCDAYSLSVTAATRFFIGNDPVSLDELRLLAYGDIPLGIYYIKDTGEVTRIVLYRDRPQQNR